MQKDTTMQLIVVKNVDAWVKSILRSTLWLANNINLLQFFSFLFTEFVIFVIFLNDFLLILHTYFTVFL